MKLEKAMEKATIHEKVGLLLSIDEGSRNCNYHLYDVYVATFHPEVCRFIEGKVFYHIEKGVPLQETVSRKRRLWQEAGYFLPSKEVQQMREKNEADILDEVRDKGPAYG